MTQTKPVRVRKARATSVCPYCKIVITRGEQIAAPQRRPFGHIAHFLPASEPLPLSQLLAENPHLHREAV